MSWVNRMINFSGRSLTAFLALAECRQFTLAADRCHMSQSAFSQMITRLEDQVGVRLFERDTRNVWLTPEGELLMPFARRLEADAQAVTTEIRDHAEGRRGKVAMAALPSLADEWLPRAIADFRSRFPGVRVQLSDVISEPGLELVRQGAVDFALNARTAHPDEFDVRPLATERFYLVCQPGHALAGRKRIAPRQLAGCSYIHSPKTGSVWPYLSPFLVDVPLVDTGLEVFHFSTLAGLIANGLGVSVIPEFSLNQFHRRGLVSVPVIAKGLQRQLLVIKRRGQALSVAAQAMLNSIDVEVKAQRAG